MKKYFKKRKLVNFHEKIKNPSTTWPQWYLDIRKPEIQMMEWLIAYYDGRTASTPKEYLEALINKTEYYQDYANVMKSLNIVPMSEVDRLDLKLKYISFLYNWVHYKKITGF